MGFNSIQEGTSVQFGWSSALSAGNSGSMIPSRPIPSVPATLSAEAVDISSISAAAADSVQTDNQPNIAVSLAQPVSGTAHAGMPEMDRFVATVPNPLGASATGATMEMAEYNLSVLLDAIV